MTSKMQFRIRTLCLALGALVPLAFAGAVNAAADAAPATAAAPAAATATEPLEQLKEVFVHGKKLATEIARAEDDLYSLYNRLNKNHDYDIVCGNMSQERGSLITTRQCVPGFVADEAATGAYMPSAYIPGASIPSYNSYSSCNQTYVVGQDLNGGTFYQAGCVPTEESAYSVTARSYSQNSADSSMDYWNTTYADPATNQIYLRKPLSQERRQAYADNVMKVIHSDLRLTKAATRLAGLYEEMNTVQANYAERKAEDRAARVPAKPNLGPRKL